LCCRGVAGEPATALAKVFWFFFSKKNGLSLISSATQPIGPAIAGWTKRPLPPRTNLHGRFCRLEILDAARHGPALWAAFQLDREGRNWTYLPYGPFAGEAEFHAWLDGVARRRDLVMHAVADGASGAAIGLAAYLRIDPDNGTIEVGHLNFSPLLQRRPAATEAMYLLMRRAFDELGYRRYEWKCDALNAPSRKAAERLGFRFEGVFRQAVVVKGRNRDTAWFSIIDAEWPALRARFEAWLAPENFGADGGQRRRLSMIEPA
jgi:RimJ/RimL family protein N-acetyltransferase